MGRMTGYLKRDGAAVEDVWNRSTDWTPGTTQGSTDGNPDLGVKPSGAWLYESVPLGRALGQNNPWYAGTPTKLTWDINWNSSGVGGWTDGDNVAPLVQSTTITQTLNNTRVPVVRWLNLTGSAVTVALSGAFSLSWNTDGGPAFTKTIEFLMMLQNPDGTRTPLVMETRRSPDTVGIPIDLRAVQVPAGGSIFYTFRYEDAAGRAGWITLNDENMSITLMSLAAAPLSVNDFAVADESMEKNVNVLANDKWAPQTLPRVSIVTGPTNGTAVVEADQSITYAPASGFTGADSLTYRVFDGTNYSSNATLSLTAPPRICLFVDPINGDDSNNGRNQGTAVRTIESARDKVQALRAAYPESSVTVMLADGEYRSDHTIKFDAGDSGTAAFPVTYCASGSNAVIKGSKKLNLRWTPAPDQAQNHGAYVADLSEEGLSDSQLANINSLFVNNSRATRAREPDVGYYTIASAPRKADPQYGAYTDSFTYKNTDLDGWFNGLPTPDTQRAEVIHYTNWKEGRMRLASVDTATNLATIQGRIYNPNGGYDADYGGPANGTARYYVENILRGLDEEGEWYLDPVAKKLYYKPLAGENINTVTFEVPVVKELIKMTGTRDVGFHGLTFTQTDWAFGDWTGIPNHGNSKLFKANLNQGVQTGQVGNSHTLFQDPQNNLSAIHLNGASNISFVKNTFTSSGFYAIRAEWNASGIAIVKNTFTANGAGAIMIGGWTGNRPFDDTQTNVSRNHRIALNVSHDNEAVWRAANDIFITRIGNNWITGNKVYNAEHQGIHVGWFDTRLDAVGHNQVLWNNVSNVMRTTYDGAGIYVIGNQPGAAVMGNTIHGVMYTEKHLYRGDAGPHPGIYIDENAGGMLVMGNMIYDVNYGIFSNPARSMICVSNIIVDVQKAAFHMYYYSDSEKIDPARAHQGQNWWSSNVAAWTRTTAAPVYLVDKWIWRTNNTSRFTMDRDIYSYGPVSENPNGSLSRLQTEATGGGAHENNAAVTTAPMFVNPETQDYRIDAPVQPLVKGNGFAADWLLYPKFSAPARQVRPKPSPLPRRRR